jgi:dihydropyrimidine dehydrogenase (NAD+) subunit PreA
MATLETEFAGVRMRNPLILSSATPSWDGAHCHEAWQNDAGAIVPKSLAPPVKFAQHPRSGRMKIIREGRRQIGMINIELYTTMDLRDWLQNDLQEASKGDSCIIASVVAHPDPESTARNARMIEESGKVAMFEINVSCPMPADESKVGFQMGNDPLACQAQIRAIKDTVSLPVGIKLSPTTDSMVPVAEAAEAAGADFLTIGNSVRAFAGVDVYTGLPKLPAYGGYSGPAIKPITQRHVSEVARAVSTPISACGGVSTWEDVVEYIMLGASTVQLCTSIMWKGYAHFRTILEGLTTYMENQGLESLASVRGQALPHIMTIDEVAKRPPLVAHVDPATCTNLKGGGCELCRNVCFYGAIAFAPRLQVNPEKCDGCNLCVEICPNGALRLISPAT